MAISFLNDQSISGTLTVTGNARVTGSYYDSLNSPGTSGQVLSSTVTGTDWVDTPSSDYNLNKQIIPTGEVLTIPLNYEMIMTEFTVDGGLVLDGNLTII
jgi:hypothetical protein